QLKGFFTPWHYTSVPMAWENRWVSVQPIATLISAPEPAATAAPTARRTPVVAASPSPVATSDPGPTLESSPAEVAVLTEPVAGVPRDADSATQAPSTPSSDDQPMSLVGGLALLVAASLAVIGGLALRARRGS
ncbi:MAG TPA: hypothetical protein VIM39_02700, partial [Candidatus Limnocylindrales bacterium]